MESSNYSRRQRLDLNTIAEISIRNAIYEVEKVGADVALTDVVTLLNQAFEKLADYNESDKQNT